MGSIKQVLLVCAAFWIIFFGPTTSSAQPNVRRASKLDEAVESGLKAVRSKDWEAALRELATSRQLQEKEGFSGFLYDNISLPDEDRSSTGITAEERQITSWRHAMGARQAIIAFQAYTSALAGKHADAKLFADEVYKTQSAVWGLSWRAFNPPIYDLFRKYVQLEKSEGYGRFLYISGDLLLASDDDRGETLIIEAQTFLPRDAELAATLAGIYMMSDRAAEAKKQAELSLSIRPGQASVYIDLANAEWIMGNISAAKKSALQAKSLRPDLPGPNATLTFVSIEEGDLKAAKEFAEAGSRLSEKHKFYQTVLAAYEAASDNKARARTLMKEAWGDAQPTLEMLKAWFFRRKPLDGLIGL